jgi:hypothetical protein
VDAWDHKQRNSPVVDRLRPEMDDWVIFGFLGLVTQSRIDSTAICSARSLPGGWPDASQVCLGIKGSKCGRVAP